MSNEVVFKCFCCGSWCDPADLCHECTNLDHEDICKDCCHHSYCDGCGVIINEYDGDWNAFHINPDNPDDVVMYCQKCTFIEQYAGDY